ncbi:MAG: NAD(P)/FAD-dependent oxidoreductase [Polyangiaceae bacterium]
MTTRASKPRIAIIGAGFGGLCAAIQLSRAGYPDFFIVDKGSSVGGTWRDNVYPGAACDTPSFAYCFSFDQKKDWTRKWAKQPEIVDYIERLAIKHDLLSRTRLGLSLEAAEHRDGRWQLTFSDGSTEAVDVLITSVGQLNRPKIPSIPGLESFTGARFHTAEWDTRFDPRDKRVALVGTGASAIQIVPELAPVAKELVLFQRSPNWILPKNDRVYGAAETLAFSHAPGLARLYRSGLWLSYELRYGAIRERPLFSTYARWLATRHLEAQVADPDLRQKLTPSYPVAAKRVLISDDYYPAVCRSNVTLLAEPVSAIDATGLFDQAGRHYAADAIVFATGFETTSFLAPMRIVGPTGTTLDETWRDGAEAYLGIRVSGFPNLFMTYGPNTNLGHNSILFMLECQTHYIVRCLELAERRGFSWTDVTPQAQAQYNTWLQADLQHTAWAKVDRSWYMTESGKITNNWPRSTTEYWLRTRRVRERDLVGG